MSNNSAEMERVGRMVATAFDDTMGGLRRYLQNRSNPTSIPDIIFSESFNERVDDEKYVYAAQVATRSFLHRLFAEIDYGEDLVLMIKDENGNLSDIREHTDLLPEETAIWLENYSEFGSEIIKIGNRGNELVQQKMDSRKR